MGEIEAWKATGRRALRIAQQRGWTDRPLRLTLLGGGFLALAASTHLGHPMMHHPMRFGHRVVTVHVSHGFGSRTTPFGVPRGTGPLAPVQPPAAPAPPLTPSSPSVPNA